MTELKKMSDTQHINLVNLVQAAVQQKVLSLSGVITVQEEVK